MNSVTFGDALHHLKSGRKVQRTGWNGKGLWLELQEPDAHSKMTLPYIFMSYPADAANTPAERACKVELTLRYDFDNSLLAAMVGPAFEKIANTMVDAFVKRAGTIYVEH